MFSSQCGSAHRTQQCNIMHCIRYECNLNTLKCTNILHPVQLQCRKLMFCLDLPFILNYPLAIV